MSARDRRYAGIDVPRTESLKDTIARVAALLRSRDRARAARRASACSLPRTAIRCGRSIKHLSDIGDDEIVGLEIPTGEPIVYDLADDLTVRDRYYLAERA